MEDKIKIILILRINWERQSRREENRMEENQTFLYTSELATKLTTPVISPVLGPDDVNLVVAEMPRLLQHALFARRGHP